MVTWVKRFARACGWDGAVALAAAITLALYQRSVMSSDVYRRRATMRDI